MLSYFLKCRKNMQSKNTEVLKAKNGRTISKCSVCNSKSRNFLKNKKLEDG